jgi:hypothetical protein
MVTNYLLPALAAAAAVSGAYAATNTAMESYDLAFYNDFASNAPNYYKDYYSFLVSHTFTEVTPQYTSDLNAIFAGDDYTSIINENDGLVTVLYEMATEFPWYSQWAATATVTRPVLTSIAPLQGQADFSSPITTASGAGSSLLTSSVGPITSAPTTSPLASSSAGGQTSAASSAASSAATNGGIKVAVPMLGAVLTGLSLLLAC